MRVCPKCSQHFPDGAQFCPSDGSALGPAQATAIGTPPADPRLGTMVDRYRIVAPLGAGGMGAVYRAEHTLIGRPVALKLLHPDLARDPGVVDRFFREARAANEIQSEHIVQVTDFGTAPDGASYLVMELLTGQSLHELLEQQPGHRLPPARAIAIAHQVTEALAAAHAKGIVHRDLKPGNITLVTRDGRPDFVKVLDFGIAKLTEQGATQLTKTGTIMGSPAYMSPEQAMGKGVDHRTDIYALGVILFEMLVGSPPFVGETATAILLAHLSAPVPPPRSLCPDIPDALQAIILQCLAKNVAERPQTMQALGGMLAAALQGGAVQGVMPTIAAAAPVYAPSAVPPTAGMAAQAYPGVAPTLGTGVPVAGAPTAGAPLVGPPPSMPPTVAGVPGLTGPALPATAYAPALAPGPLTGPAMPAQLSPGPVPQTGFGSAMAPPGRKLGTGHWIAIASAAVGVAAGVVVAVVLLGRPSSTADPAKVAAAAGSAGSGPVSLNTGSGPAAKGEAPRPEPKAAEPKAEAPKAEPGAEAPKREPKAVEAKAGEPAGKEPVAKEEPAPVEPVVKKKAPPRKKAAKIAAPPPEPVVVAPPPPPPVVRPPPPRSYVPPPAQNRYQLDQQLREGRINAIQYNLRRQQLIMQMQAEIQAVHAQRRMGNVSFREKRAAIKAIRMKYGW
jgi:serine/threonine-protein kinase